MQSSSNPSAGSQSERLIALIAPMIAPLGYEVVYVEVLTHRQKTLRLFIDFSETPKPDENGEIPSIGIEDCVKVTKALDEPLDQTSEVESVFHGAYELEVSSPGVDRPLRQAKDFERFRERQVRIHTFRPLSGEEIGNENYLAKNPRQKNFLGVLKGLLGERIRLAIDPSQSNAGTGKGKKNGKSGKSTEAENNAEKEILIPMTLVSKANIEPVFDFSDTE
jgi:ribosome maturation factor RimP